MNKIFKILGALLVIAGMVLVLRFAIGGNEDTWICQNGQWVKHGNPSGPKPVINCEEGDTIPKGTQIPEGRVFPQEESRAIAQTYAEGTSTYKFDGKDLQLVETEVVVSCPSCYRFGYHFESRRSGYGNRENQITAAVITPHELMIIMEQGKVVSAVVDGRFDEMLQRYVK